MRLPLMMGFFGLIGIFSRYGINVVLGRATFLAFPVSTFVINLVGSFFIGVLYILGVENAFVSQDMRIALMVGLLGGFTTFSSYSLETSLLLKNEQFLLAFSYVLASTVGGILLTFAGIFLTRALVK